MRETRVAQISIFECYSEHEYGAQLNALSRELDKHPEILPIIEKDFLGGSEKSQGRTGLSVESVFRCLLLKQNLQVSYERLAFHLSDSVSFRSFARLSNGVTPSRSGLQSTIRSIQPETLKKVKDQINVNWLDKKAMTIEKLRTDSTVVKSDIAPPSDSQLLNDGVRVLSRNLAKCHASTGERLRFTDKRKAAKSLAFQIFNAKKAVKQALYPELLKVVRVVMKQIDRALLQVEASANTSVGQQKWIETVRHYKDLMLKVINQTERRVIHKEKVPSSEKVVSIFESHTDVIVKGFREILYGHKINLSTQQNGFITYCSIEKGNPSDTDLFLPPLEAHQATFGGLPTSVVADGGYASQANVSKGRELGIKHVVFHKPIGISLHEMGVKAKTFKALRNFRAGVEGNISELKRAFGAGKAKWKGHDGFQAFVWSSVISYNLMRMARLNSG